MTKRPPLVLIALLLVLSPSARAEVTRSEANRVAEWSFTSTKAHADPFNEVELDAVFTAPDGTELRVPAFWAGGQTWKLRYASPVVGKHAFRTVCSDATSNLHGVEGSVEITPYAGDNPLYKHGPIRVAADKRHFEHVDGTPFFWLGDTWWMGLTKRLKWPEGFQTLAADRKKKGFTLVQIVAGLYPDMPAFDPRGENETGFPWEKEYARVRPEYFDAADQRINHLVEQGFMPCIVSTWGFHLPWLGESTMKKHQRYVYARWGALPMVWCVAGELNLPFYTNPGFPAGGEKQAAAWEPVLKYCRTINGFDRLITAHPSLPFPMSMRRAWADQTLLDFDMLQTPHGQMEAVSPTVQTVRASYDAKPVMPVVNAEPSYEMLFDKTPPEVARMMFWVSWGSGVGGYTYGANGIWQVNGRDQRYGKSPTGGDYGAIAWEDAMKLQGGAQVAMAKKLLSEFAWHRFEPKPAWASYATGSSTDVALGDWIWFPEGEPAADAPIAPRFFRTSFDVPPDATIERALLRAAADNQCTIWINGRELGTHADLTTLREFDLAGKVAPGRNVIAVRAANVYSDVTKNPAGFICGLSIALAGGKRIEVTSGSDWRSAQEGRNGWYEPKFDDSNWSPARVAAKYGDAPWRKFSDGQDPTFEPYTTGIAGEARIVYVPQAKPVTINALEPDVTYESFYFDPATGKRSAGPSFTRDDRGAWRVPPPAESASQDWVLVMKRK
jgi:hypothetical protein